MIQLIEKHGNRWALLIYGEVCYFYTRPLTLFHKNFTPLKPDANLRWRIEGKKVSYRQIKKAICG